MKDIFTNDKSKEDVEGIKKDIESLVERLGDLKNHSIESLSEPIESLYSATENLKNKGIDIGRDNAAAMFSITRRHPLRMLMCAFGLGMIIATCLTKNKS